MFTPFCGPRRALVGAALAALLLPSALAHSSTIATSTLSGWVYVDRNNDGILAFVNDPLPEFAIGDVEVILYQQNGASEVELHRTTTDATGYYAFGGLGAGTYAIRQTQPVEYVDGKDTAGWFWPATAGAALGTIANNAFTDIVLPTQSVLAQGFNFGELGMMPAYVSKRYLLTSSPVMPLIPNVSIPEPTSLALGLLALLGSSTRRRR